SNIPRDVFYRDVAFFKSQINVDRAVDDLAATFGVPRHCLNIHAATKGLIAGPCLLHVANHPDPIPCHVPTLIPPPSALLRISLQPATRFVLVVEKEATFRSLVDAGFCRRQPGGAYCVLVTGKGYPDVATRAAVRKLEEMGLPVFALVDADPHGVDIWLCYKMGSKSMVFDAANLATPSVRWVGLKPSDRAVPRNRLLPLTQRDKDKARAMLRRTDLAAPERRELSRMLWQNAKAEIQAVDLDVLIHSLEALWWK
ncbi:Spo11/DNA topoisomerase VI subunit A, partial [Zopfochytrium polystomum]